MTSPSTVQETRAKLRAAMPVVERWAYFDHAAVAPLPSPAVDVLRNWASEAAAEGDTAWPRWASAVENTRRIAAQLIGATAEEIALVPNTTTGISLVAEGIDWQPGDNVVTLADEFPSNAYPWLNLAARGVQTRRVDTNRGQLNLDELDAACDKRTRIVSVSWIGYSTGYRQPVEAIANIAHAHGALLLVDAIQGLGAFPLNVDACDIDFLAADGHKWMLGPEGAGIFYVRNRRLDDLRPLGVGWNSVVHAHDFNRIELRLKPTAARYEGGSQNMAGMMALGASLQLLCEVGIERVADVILAVSDLACERLQELGAAVVSHRRPDSSGHDPRSGIVTFELPGQDPQQVRQRCLEQRVALACRGGRLRISPHAYNNEEDVERLIDALVATPSSPQLNL